MQPITGDALRGHLETMVLSVLESDETHGFEIWRRLEEAGSGALHLKEGSLYPAIYRLEKKGLLKSQWEAGNNGRRGPRRRLYRLTSKGKKQLDQGRQHFQQFVSVIGRIVGAPHEGSDDSRRACGKTDLYARARQV